MLATAIIVFREVLEAALIVGIVMAASQGVMRRGWWVGGGIAAGIVGAAAMTLGGLLGLAAGVAAGAGLYFGLVRIPLRHLFSVTSWLVLLLAAGMASQAAAFLLQADLLPPLGTTLWDTSFLLSDQSLVGRVLHTLVGYTAQPAGIQLVFYLATLFVIGSLMRLVGGAPPVARARHAHRPNPRLQPGE